MTLKEIQEIRKREAAEEEARKEEARKAFEAQQKGIRNYVSRKRKNRKNFSRSKRRKNVPC